MSPALDQLRDIRGLDPLPWWPLAPGWWFVLAGFLFVILVLYFVRDWWHRRPGGDWRRDAGRQIRALRERLAWADARTLAGELSELLRRIAIAHVGRRGCAGLVNEEWLAWLEAHDPTGFGWRTEGQILIQLPYAPPGERSSAAGLQKLVDAAEEWVRREDEPAQGAPALKVKGVAELRAWVGGRLGRSGTAHV